MPALTDAAAEYAKALAELHEFEVEAARRETASKVTPVFLPLRQPARYKGAWGGRGSGKSHEFAEQLVHRCVARTTRAVCVREHQVSLEQSVKRLLEDKIRGFGLVDKFHIRTNAIETPHDGLIIFQGMKDHTADSIKSLEGYDIAWVEEAQSLSARSLALLRPTIRKEDSELWFSWNPALPTDPVDALLRGPVPPPDAVVVQATWADNPYFPDVLRREMEWDRSRDQETYDHIWGGDYEKHAEARVFKNWKVLEFETPDDVVLRYGGDWGYAVDPTVLIRCYLVGEKTLRIDHEAYQVGCEIDETPNLFRSVPGAESWPITADSARPETISYLQRHGFPRMKPAKKGPDSVKEGIIFLQGYDIEVHPRCTRTIQELKRYAYKKDHLTGQVTPILQDKENHVIDSLRYAVEDLREPVEFLTW